MNIQIDNISIILSIIILLSPYILRKRLLLTELSGLVTTFGILGTFIGIFIGLINFEVNNITASVPKLLEGLKTAFMTSIAGMTAGILLKVFPQIYFIKVLDDSSEKASIETMIKILYEITKNQKEFSDKENDQLKKIEKALCGDGETTLLTQIQKLRVIISDKQDELIKEFKDFTKNMSENNSKALIEALSQVIRDFNTKINEQFGDNFKQLNVAVANILVWQKQYKEQVEKMSEQFDRALHGINYCEKSLISIKENAEHFSEIAKNLDGLLRILNDERQKISENLKVFSDIALNAKSAFPVIHKEITKLTTEFSKKVEETTKEIAQVVLNHKESLSKQGDLINEAQKNVNGQLTQMITNLNVQIEKLMRENAERISKQVKELDTALGKELEKSLQSLGNQLASLSRRFVEDYTPLTDKLKELMNIANNGR
jgi:biopolymer transport protein ExbB/TolQ